MLLNCSSPSLRKLKLLKQNTEKSVFRTENEIKSRASFSDQCHPHLVMITDQ